MVWPRSGPWRPDGVKRLVDVFWCFLSKSNSKSVVSCFFTTKVEQSKDMLSQHPSKQRPKKVYRSDSWNLLARGGMGPHGASEELVQFTRTQKWQIQLLLESLVENVMSVKNDVKTNRMPWILDWKCLLASWVSESHDQLKQKAQVSLVPKSLVLQEPQCKRKSI